jgi:transcriptional regulator with XRE-family HTH domain
MTDAFRIQKRHRNMKPRRVKKLHSEAVKAFARRLRRTRAERGISQMKLASKTEVNLSYLGRLERAEASPSIDLVKRLADGLGVAMQDLLVDIQKPGEPVSRLKQQARENLEQALEKAEAPVLQMMSLWGSLLNIALSRGR